MKSDACAIIVGGTGFIGSFFARYLLEQAGFAKVYLLDVDAPAQKSSVYRQKMLATEMSGRDARIVFIQHDIRQPIDWRPAEAVSLIANFAAVHREPGHEAEEYYHTNLLGAEHVCAFAEQVGCTRLIFTSSISPYGLSIEAKDEQSLPVPISPYGGSKLVAEKIHQIWQAKDPARRLIIVRPGVVFGPGEGGNVTRLIRAVLRGYFIYMGNRETRKAGVYVKELCLAMLWAMQQQEAKNEGVMLFNMSMNPGPSLQEYVDTISKIAAVRRKFMRIPYPILLTAAYVIDTLAKPLGIRHPFSPVRIKKLVRPNNILPTYLVEHGYPFAYSLESALRDWREECPEEWT